MDNENKNIDFSNENAVIEIEDSPNYLEKVQKVSEIIAALPLTEEQNNQLIDSLTDMLAIARQEAFIQGTKTVAEYMKWEEEQAEELIKNLRPNEKYFIPS